MMVEIACRKDGKAGRITLNRPKALNALTYDMVREIEAALDAWATDPEVAFILIEGEGDRAFCAGGDIADLYATGTSGDFAWGQQFWRDEYRMNAKAFEFPKPYISFLQGFTMGGGVGVGCHGSHRIVCETSQIAMPECGIGLVPDVGGSLLLAQAPGRLGEFLGTTTTRMGAGDAILCGFADYFVPQDRWDDLKAELAATGNWKRIDDFAAAPPEGELAAMQDEIDAYFAGETLADIVRNMENRTSAHADKWLKAITKNSPLSCACAVEMTHRLRGRNSIRYALEMEYRYTFRAMEHGDFLEGIRAAIIDKDRNPKWRHDGPSAPTAMDVAQMLLPLGPFELNLKEVLG